MKSEKDILFIAMITFITVTVWIFVELAKTRTETVVSESAKEILMPLNPEFDTETLEKLNEKRIY